MKRLLPAVLLPRSPPRRLLALGVVDGNGDGYLSKDEWTAGHAALSAKKR